MYKNQNQRTLIFFKFVSLVYLNTSDSSFFNLGHSNLFLQYKFFFRIRTDVQNFIALIIEVKGLLSI